MTWFITAKKQINCAETGVWYSHHDDGWWCGRFGGHEMRCKDSTALALLVALGYRWTGTAIEKIGAPPEAANEPKLVRVDLSEPAERGVYVVRDSSGDWDRHWAMAAGEPWSDGPNTRVAAAWKLVTP